MHRILGSFTIVAIAAVLSATAFASPPGTTHSVTSSNLRELVLTGLESCNLFGGNHVFRGADLALQLNQTEATIEGSPLVISDANATLHGTIMTEAGTYTVAGHFVEESVVRDPADEFFLSTSGRAVISGPTGTVVGGASLRWLGGPEGFDLAFENITNCRTS